jgi:hypothetical protein
MDNYMLLIDLAFSLGKSLVASLTKAKAPQEVIDAAQKAVDAIDVHAADTMTKEQWEQLRG